MLKKCGKSWCLFSKSTGKLLGKHPTRANAMKQEVAISLSKARKSGHNVPKQ